MDVTQNDSANEAAPEQAAAEESAAVEQPEQSEPSGEQPAEDVPQPRSAEPEPDPEPAPAAQEAGGGKAAKKRKAAPKSKTAAGTKSLVVFREGKVHYADESVVVLDLDDAANPDTDVHDVVDKLSELRDAVESPGRAEAVTLIGELIQAKALA